MDFNGNAQVRPHPRRSLVLACITDREINLDTSLVAVAPAKQDPSAWHWTFRDVRLGQQCPGDLYDATTC